MQISLAGRTNDAKALQPASRLCLVASRRPWRKIAEPSSKQVLSELHQGPLRAIRTPQLMPYHSLRRPASAPNAVPSIALVSYLSPPQILRFGNAHVLGCEAPPFVFRTPQPEIFQIDAGKSPGRFRPLMRHEPQNPKMQDHIVIFRSVCSFVPARSRQETAGVRTQVFGQLLRIVIKQQPGAGAEFEHSEMSCLASDQVRISPQIPRSTLRPRSNVRASKLS
ncbi:hypothetical protein FB451DRAFT_633569 [Mycena latifolia]|nr:hypothetical protein FB451DRAFT_633569 [Mycena latifolia]